MKLSFGGVISQSASLSKDRFEDGKIGKIFIRQVCCRFLFFLLHHCFSLENVELLLGLSQLLLQIFFLTNLGIELILDQFIGFLKVSKLLSLSSKLALIETSLFYLKLQLSNPSLM